MWRVEGIFFCAMAALALLLLSGAVAENRCGTSWPDADGKCGTKCPGGVDSECPAANEACFGDLDACGSSSSGQVLRRCGVDWQAAFDTCTASLCPGNTDLECDDGNDEHCYDVPGAPECIDPNASTPDCGEYRRCGDTWQDAYNNCYAPHCPGNSDVECPGTQECFTVAGKDCGSNFVTSHALDFTADAGTCPGSSVSGMTRAKLTAYSSYPTCCFVNPPLTGDTECSDYNGCTWAGQFANGETLTEPEVRCADIAAVFDANADWATTYKDKTMRLVVCHGGAVVNDFTVEVKDTCGDDDCNGCCSNNAASYAGKLVDLEINTLYRNVGTSIPDSIYFEVL